MASVSQKVQDAIQTLKEYAVQDEANRAEVRDALNAATAEVQTPFDQLHEITFAGPAMASVLRICLDMGLFSRWIHSGGGPKTTNELATLTNSDPILLARLLKHLAAMNKIKEVDTDYYVLTPFSEAMGKPGISDGIRLLYHSTWPVLAHLPKFLKSKDYENPSDGNDAAWHDMTGSKVGWVEQLQLDNDRLLDFQNTMQMYAFTGNWVKTYPTEQLFDGYDPKRPLVVDAGGGKGQDLNLFLEKHPDLVEGSLVLEELPSVVESIRHEVNPFIKVVPHDIFQPQPIKEARAYFTHSVFHGWDDEEAIRALKVFASAMKPRYSKLLLNEKVVPAKEANRTTTTGDVIMVASFSASERTQADWERLLTAAGLKLVKIWQSPIYTECVIEGELNV